MEPGENLHRAFCKAKEGVGPGVKKDVAFKRLPPSVRDEAEAAVMLYVIWLFRRTLQPEPCLREFSAGTAKSIRSLALRIAQSTMDKFNAWNDAKLTPEVEARLRG